MANAEGRDLRLTLRTLLAYLDDQLSPPDVRQLGQKVNESPFTRELIARIQQVTRRRRLTVPGATGGEATDANLVASYLDNELSPERVAEYEEKCLRSDVDLAEVASCHQILSMMGQKAKVPPEARFRMYRLIKGPEAVGPGVPRAFTPPPAEPAAKPIPQWSTPGGSRGRSLLERYGPLAAVVALMLLMGISAWQLIPDTPQQPADQDEVVADAAADPARQAAPPIRGPVPPPPVDLPPGPAPVEKGMLAGQPGTEPAETKGAEEAKAAEETADAAGAAPPAAAEPYGVVTDAGEGLLARWNPATETWTHLGAGEALEIDERIAVPAPFRAEVRLGDAQVLLVGPAAIRTVRSEPGEAARLALDEGRVVVRRGGQDGPITAQIEGQTVTIRPPADAPVGLERIDVWPLGASEPSLPSLAIYASEGPVALQASNASETIGAAGSVILRTPAGFSNAAEGPPPAWVTDAEPTEVEQLTGAEFANYFAPGVPITRALAEAMTDDEAAIRSLAVEALGLLGKLDLVLSAMNQDGDQALRRAAINTLRASGDNSPVAARNLRALLSDYARDDAWTATVYKLLSGYSAVDARAEATYILLVGLLDHRDVGVRELALMRLTALTGRDTLDYDPDEPSGPGLDAWKSLLRAGTLVPKEPAAGAPGPGAGPATGTPPAPRAGAAPGTGAVPGPGAVSPPEPAAPPPGSGDLPPPPEPEPGSDGR